MISNVNFLRPAWFFALIPLGILAYGLLRRSPKLHDSWSAICDPHLLDYLLHTKASMQARITPWVLLTASLFMIIALAGPSWTRLPVPTYKKIQPLVILLDMSEKMAANDLTPNRLQRAKFILHDILQHTQSGQFALIAYSGEPFVVSPLTDDAQTIDALLPALTLDVIPVGGQALDRGLQQAAALLQQSGFNQGKVMVLTPTPPNAASLEEVKRLAKQGIYTSIIPTHRIPNGEGVARSEAFFERFANVGGGKVFPLETPVSELINWTYTDDRTSNFIKNEDDRIPRWRDEGRWFIWPALLCLLAVFRRGALNE